MRWTLVNYTATILPMGEAQAAKLPPPSAPAERERFIAAVKRGLEDVRAGRVHSHDEVVAEMRERFPAVPAK